jgi:hypothetical protein
MSSRENERMYDLRVLERNIRKGMLTRKDVDRFLKALPDRADNAMSITFEPGQSREATLGGGNAVGEGNTHGESEGEGEEEMGD